MRERRGQAGGPCTLPGLRSGILYRDPRRGRGLYNPQGPLAGAGRAAGGGPLVPTIPMHDRCAAERPLEHQRAALLRSPAASSSPCCCCFRFVVLLAEAACLAEAGSPLRLDLERAGAGAGKAHLPRRRQLLGAPRVVVMLVVMVASPSYTRSLAGAY